jgi:collagen beta-1,O-galactosyltransferase
MVPKFVSFCVILCFGSAVLSEWKKPTVFIAILARNKAHTLPYFLATLENLDYPKDRISLWIRSDHNTDRTIELLEKWIAQVKDQYHMISTEFVKDQELYPDERGPAHWTKERFDHVISLRESALNFARKIWADYFLTVDCDVFLTNPNTLNFLISKNYTIVAPMLKSDGLYSNFWHGMTEDYYYLRTDDYKPVLNRERIGCFNVPMVHSCVLVDLRRHVSDRLTYYPENVSNFDGPVDDIITFAIAANRSGVSLNLCNEEQFGFVMVPLEQDDKLSLDYEQMRNIKLEVLTDEKPLLPTKSLEQYTSLPEKDQLGFDKIFMINLVRRPERRKRMKMCFDELGLLVTIVDAVDGKALNASVLQQISPLPEYADPYHKRPMTLGEIGCFLSHYNIWREIVRNGYETTLVLEDDIRFESFFRSKVLNVMTEVKRVSGWDLVYFGRKRLQENDEPWVDGSNLLVEAGYSYWTLGYVLSLNGAKKLLKAEPLSRLVPVDEYLPILFDKHPQTSWKGYFPQRNLVALSAAPLLVYPTHYTGEQGYISDTEDSIVIKDSTRSSHDDL